MTVPVERVVLAGVQPARIVRINAVEGGVVRVGDVVVNLEESVQAARTEIAKATAESTLSIEHARARWDRARRDLDRLIKLHGKEFASSKEMNDAVADEQITHIEYELANFNLSQAARAYERERAALEEFRLRAPFDGVVVEHLKHPGETVNELEGIVRLVQLDPLKVVVDCPLDTAATVLVGDRYWVRPADSRRPPRVGTVHLAGPVVDAGSQTFKVKLTVDNADGAWMAGMKVIVDFDAPVAMKDPSQVHSGDLERGGDDVTVRP